MAVLTIKGMSCQHCVASVKEALEKVEGVDSVEVDLEKGQATYQGDVAVDELKKVIAGIGFEAE